MNVRVGQRPVEPAHVVSMFTEGLAAGVVDDLGRVAMSGAEAAVSARRAMMGR